MQRLVKEKGVLDIDRTYADGGEKDIMGTMGGAIIQIRAGRPPMSLIHRRGKTFIYDDGTPVNDLAHVQHLPTKELDGGRTINPREMAEAFVRAQLGEPAHSAGGPTIARAAAGRVQKKGGVKVKGADNPRRLRSQTPPVKQDINLDKMLGQSGRQKPERVTDPDQA